MSGDKFIFVNYISFIFFLHLGRAIDVSFIKFHNDLQKKEVLNQCQTGLSNKLIRPDCCGWWYNAGEIETLPTCHYESCSVREPVKKKNVENSTFGGGVRRTRIF